MEWFKLVNSFRCNKSQHLIRLSTLLLELHTLYLDIWLIIFVFVRNTLREVPLNLRTVSKLISLYFTSEWVRRSVFWDFLCGEMSNQRICVEYWVRKQIKCREVFEMWIKAFGDNNFAFIWFLNFWVYEKYKHFQQKLRRQRRCSSGSRSMPITSNTHGHFWRPKLAQRSCNLNGYDIQGVSC